MGTVRFLFAAALATASIHAQTRSFTAERALESRSISDLRFSPDGQYLATTVSEPVKGAAALTHVWMLDVAKREFRQFTYSAKADRSPRWSPDSKTVAFTSNRGESNQIFVIGMTGGEAAALTDHKGGVGDFACSPDGTRVAFLAKEPVSDAEEKKQKDKDDAKVADREDQLSRVWVIDLATKKERQVTKGAWKISQMDWTGPNQLVAVASAQPRDESFRQELYTIDVASGSWALIAKPAVPFGNMRLSPDRRTLAYAGARGSGPNAHDGFLQSLSGGDPINLTKSLDRPVEGFAWIDSSSLLVSLQNGFSTEIHHFDVSRTGKRLDLPGNILAFDATARGRVAYVRSAFNQWPELYLQGDGTPQQVSHVNEQLKDVTLANAELFSFKSFDGRAIEAAFLKPTSTALPKPWPLVLLVHGGPTGAYASRIDAWSQMLTARGFAVLLVNPRGSTGYGDEFVKLNRGDWGGGDFKDLMAAVDTVLARGETDPNRLGIGGWSYGGYMTDWAITQTNRFKAAVSGAGLFDLVAEFSTEDGPAYDEWFFGTPWENHDAFLHSSPYAQVRNAKTPTLILQGEDDPVDPIGQSTGLYRALKRYGVETELVTYPREPHGFREEKHRLDQLNRMAAWFEKYLKPAEPKAATVASH